MSPVGRLPGRIARPAAASPPDDARGSEATSEIERPPAHEVVVELIPFDRDDPSAALGDVAAAERAACPTLAELRDRFGGERGWLTDPWGNEHLVVLSGWPAMDPRTTHVLIRFHVVPDPLTAPAPAPAAAPRPMG